MTHDNDTIDLGVASVETRGPVGQVLDAKLGIGATGLHDD